MAMRFHLPVKILFGPGSLDQLGTEAAKLGKTALVVTYPDIGKVGILERAVNQLEAKGLKTLVFDKVEPNPRATTVDEGANLARREGAEVIVGLGGGSAMDAAKSLALTASGSKSVWSYVGQRFQPEGKVPAIIQVPTLAGTGSEINNGAIITNWETHVKSGVSHPTMFAQTAVIDPELTLSVPLNQTKAGGVDIFCHIVESYVTDTEPSPLTDGIRETVMKMVVEYLPRTLETPDDLEARTQLSWASTIAMSQLARLGGGMGSLTCHGIEHALSGYYDVTHGDGLAALLPAWMRFTQEAMAPRFDKLGRNVFGVPDGILGTDAFLVGIGMNIRLGDLGCEEDKAEEIADLAIVSSPWLSAHPIPLDREAVATIYRHSF